MPTNETHEGVDIKASPQMPADGICNLMCRCLAKGGNIVAIVPAGFMAKPEPLVTSKPQAVVDVYRMFWIEPHEAAPKDPRNGDLRITQQ